MDIEDFYNGDPARRTGEDHVFGQGWAQSDDPNVAYDLDWNDASHELYLMRKVRVDPAIGWVGFALIDVAEVEWVEHHITGIAEHLIHPRHIQAKAGKVSPRHSKDHMTEQLTVEILGKVSTLDQVNEILGGWQREMTQPDSLAWLHERLAESGVSDGKES